MNALKKLSLLTLLTLSTACVGNRPSPKGPAPGDPIAMVAGRDLRAQGLRFARRGDLIRAQQYLSAALERGADERVVMPELVKVCIASSRLRAALAFAEPYLERNPQDVGMEYVVGTIHMVLGNLERASSHLSGALQAGRLMPEALFSLALIRRERGDLDGARERLEQYLATSPTGANSRRAKKMLASLGTLGERS